MTVCGRIDFQKLLICVTARRRVERLQPEAEFPAEGASRAGHPTRDGASRSGRPTRHRASAILHGRASRAGPLEQGLGRVRGTPRGFTALAQVERLVFRVEDLGFRAQGLGRRAPPQPSCVSFSKTALGRRAAS